MVFLKRSRKGIRATFIFGVMFLAVGVALFFLLGSSEEKSVGAEGNKQTVMRMYDEYREDFPGIAEISAQDALRMAGDEKVLFIDVRDKEEQEVSMLPDAIPYQEFLKNIDKYKDRTLIGYCTISYRSGKFAQELSKNGIKMFNLKGGMLAWIHEGGKVYDRQGETHRVHVYGSKWNLLPPGYEAVW